MNDLTRNAALGNSGHECLSFTLDCHKEVQYTVKKPNYSKAIELSESDSCKGIGYQNYMGTSLSTKMKEKRKICI